MAIDLPVALTGKAAKLSFLLLDGDGAINTITVAGFMTDGTLGVGSATGGVSGDLGGFGAGVVQQAHRIEPTPIPMPPAALLVLAAGLPLAFWARHGRSR